jgi:hypothetical protein
VAVKTVWVVTHTCGHRHSHELSAKRVSQRARYARWLATTECSACWRRKRTDRHDKEQTDWLAERRAEEHAEIDTWETETAMPALDGSDKAVDWARRVRHHLLTSAYGHLWLSEDDFAERIEMPARAVTAASWWIDQRDAEPDELEELLADGSADNTVLIGENQY